MIKNTQNKPYNQLMGHELDILYPVVTPHPTPSNSPPMGWRGRGLRVDSDRHHLFLKNG